MSISPIMNTNSPSVLEGSNPNALTAEGLMLYLETRMNGLDEQINAAFDKQKKIEGIRPDGLRDEMEGWQFDDAQAQGADEDPERVGRPERREGLARHAQ